MKLVDGREYRAADGYIGVAKFQPEDGNDPDPFTIGDRCYSPDGIRVCRNVKYNIVECLGITRSQPYHPTTQLELFTLYAMHGLCSCSEVVSVSGTAVHVAKRTIEKLNEAQKGGAE